ncbi:MAG: replication factor C large subunit [Thermoplasmatota archaeon]
MDWTEKHRPRSLAAVVGNGPSLKKLREWADSWVGGAPAKRAVILAGPPGTGKTSTALALAMDMGWAPIELNASDARNADRIKRVATAGAIHQTFGDDGAFHSTGSDGGRKLIILDEADNLYERLKGGNTTADGKNLSDAGGKAQIIDTIRRTQQPIILIVNDLYGLTKGSGSALNSLADTLKFTRVNVRSIPKALAGILQKEEITAEPAVLEAIAARAGGDLRAAVRDLESICVGRTHLGEEVLGSLGTRDTTGNMFDGVRHILKSRDMDELRREMRSIDATPEDQVLWVDENLPKEYVHPEDLVRGYEALSRADVFLGRTRRKQNYRLWAYAGDLATIGVNRAKQNEGPRKFTPFGFPQWLSKMSRSRGARGVKDKLATALGAWTHQSKRKARQGQLDAFLFLFQHDEEFAVHATFDLELDDDVVALLLDKTAKSKEVKAIREQVKVMEEEAGPKQTDAFGAFESADEPEPVKPKPKPKSDGGQATLF